MKSLKKLTIVGTICLSSFVATSVYAVDTAKVTAETARMRSEANTKSSIVQLVSMNEKVNIIEKSGDWYKVKYNGKTGYINEELLDVEKNETTKNNSENKNETSEDENKISENATSGENIISNNEIQQENTTKQDNSSSLNEKIEIVEKYKGKTANKLEIRILPLINSSKIQVLNENDDIEVVEIVNNWCRVKTNNTCGWVSKNMLQSVLTKSIAESETEKSTETITDDSSKNTENSNKEDNNKEDEIKQDETKKEENKKEEEKTKTGYINVDTVNVRKEKNTSSEILTNVNKNVAVQVIGEEDNWSKVKINGITGYIASKYISDKKVEVTSRGSDEMRQPSTNIETQETVTTQENQTQETVATQENQTQETVATQESQTQETATTQESQMQETIVTPKTETQQSQSVNNTSINETDALTKSKQESTEVKQESTKKSTQSNSSSLGDAVVEYAKKYLGYKYVSGGASPSTGFDCSGFTSYVYKHFGRTLSRTSSGQRSNGTKVNKSNLQKGDILCFTGHVGIYIGNNKFIHAANPRKGVIITSLSDSYYVKNYITARRIK